MTWIWNIWGSLRPNHSIKLIQLFIELGFIILSDMGGQNYKTAQKSRPECVLTFQGRLAPTGKERKRGFSSHLFSLPLQIHQLVTPLPLWERSEGVLRGQECELSRTPSTWKETSKRRKICYPVPHADLTTMKVWIVFATSFLWA